MKVKHRIYGSINNTDGEHLIDMEDGQRWKLKNIEILKKQILGDEE